MIDFDLRPARAVIVDPHRSRADDAPESDLPPRGWYGDPAGCEPLRYWTGTAWADGGNGRPSAVVRPVGD